MPPTSMTRSTLRGIEPIKALTFLIQNRRTSLIAEPLLNDPYQLKFANIPVYGARKLICLASRDSAAYNMLVMYKADF